MRPRPKRTRNETPCMSRISPSHHHSAQHPDRTPIQRTRRHAPHRADTAPTPTQTPYRCERRVPQSSILNPVCRTSRGTGDNAILAVCHDENYIFTGACVCARMALEASKEERERGLSRWSEEGCIRATEAPSTILDVAAKWYSRSAKARREMVAMHGRSRESDMVP